MSYLQIIVAIGVVVVLWFILTYNRFVTLRNRVKEAWADIDVQLKRRYDLIPNLIETVKGYASHERELLEKVTEARTQAMGAQTIKERGDAENMLSQTLKSLFAVSENYPALRATENFLELQKELTDTEDKIQASRRFYNGNVRDFNTILQSFPQNAVAGIFNFKAAEFFEIAEAAEKEPVKVSF
ncbi:MAG: hypothetical protein A3D46_02340 [Candidatus Nealsonbacteria bacterium RIFCSPHIGHO2_02_FULL_43_13]|uniref:LemA family protein n=1 Tax=Candidatus Nealsonbacteria bacterium RIFCSPHIGHO2_02_FULL_43_13 TaxID=1801668 RepID=A0A1G2E816_9BACT|nr:MAG: hypothetical protein A3D46_02340 [Candidatus Nealsonbacteria bacterium RIFCSPHIGHO2_02_FULL_43_13]